MISDQYDEAPPLAHYIAIVHQQDDSAFGLHFPDVPGCFSAADSMSDIQANARKALALHLEGEIRPDARSPEAVRADKDVAHDLAKGAFLIAIPLQLP